MENKEVIAGLVKQREENSNTLEDKKKSVPIPNSDYKMLRMKKIN
jgi:hypothetical protein